MIRNWTYIITGYTQTAGTRSLLIDLWEKLHRESDPKHSVVLLRPWKSDWEAEAELVLRASTSPNWKVRPTIRVCGYSWGAGWGALQFCQALQRKGLDVERLALIDPVHRHPLAICRWRTLCPSLIPIYVPSNVSGRVLVFAQRMNWPQAHRVIQYGVEVHPTIVQCEHGAMDDRPEVIEKCYEFLKGTGDAP